MVKNLLRYKKNKGFFFDFNVENLANNFDKLGSWESNYGLYPGRSLFLMNENTDRFNLGKDSQNIYDVCVKA